MKLYAKISRYLLIALVIFISSIVIPKYYWLVFAKNFRAPLVYYSSIKKDFLLGMSRNKKFIHTDGAGHFLPRKTFERLTPLFSFRQLAFRGEMPDTVDGTPIDFKKLKLNFIYLNIKPKDIYYYRINLYPLFEARPDGPELKMPNEFFRITDKFEFINCETNKVEKELSERFNSALIKAGFSFPAAEYFGNPSNMKPYDDGYFIVDSKGALFHLMRIHNKPFVRKIALPSDVKVAYILIKELELGEFHGILISKDNRAFIISRDNYKLIPLPVKGYDRKTMQFKLMGNIKYRIFTLIAEDSLSAFVTDRNYNLIDTYKRKWISNKKRLPGKILSAITPFTLKMTSKNNDFVDFNFRFNPPGLISYLFTLLLLFLTAFVIRKYRKEEFTTQIIDLIIVGLTGIYGFIAVLLIRDEN